MSNVLQPFHLLVIALSGWLNRQQQEVIDYLIEENRVLKEQLEGQRLRFTDEHRLRRCTEHGQEYTEKARHRTGTGARETHLVDDLPESALGRDGCHGFLYG